MLTESDLKKVKGFFKSKAPTDFHWRSWGLNLIEEIEELRKLEREAYRKGISVAADVAKDYDKYSYHDHLVSECILGKLNVMKRRPKKNPHAKRIKEALDRLEQKIDSLGGTVRFMTFASDRKAAGKR